MATRNLVTRVAGAAAIALTLGATALTATPSQAASFSFGFGNGNGPSFSFGINNNQHHGNPTRYCLNDRQLWNAIARQGYRNIRLQDHGRRWVSARATSRGWVYRLTVNACNGQIVNRDRLWRF